MAEIKVLVEGVHQQIGDGRFEIPCTTALIKSNKNIIVDPGSFVNRNRLLEAMKKEGFKPEDIDTIILTHSHIDHTTNIFLFPKAKIFMKFAPGEYPGQFQELDKGVVNRFDILNEEIAKDVKIIEAPGHTMDMIAIVVKTKEGIVVISGDAIGTEGWADLNKKPDKNMVADVEKYEESRQKILKIADYIIPGHGKMFKVKK